MFKYIKISKEDIKDQMKVFYSHYKLAFAEPLLPAIIIRLLRGMSDISYLEEHG